MRERGKFNIEEQAHRKSWLARFHPALCALAWLGYMGIIAVWLRSYWSADTVTLRVINPNGPTGRVVSLLIESQHGEIALAMLNMEPTAGSAFSEDQMRTLRAEPRWEFQTRVDSGGYQPSHWWEKFGFSWIYSPVSFAGLLVVTRALVAPYWFATLIAIAPSAILSRRLLGDRILKYRAAHRLCPACGYDLRATMGRCPECGAAAHLERSV